MSPLYGQTEIDLKNSLQLNKEALSIPIHPRMSDQDVQTVIDAVKKYLDNRDKKEKTADMVAAKVNILNEQVAKHFPTIPTTSA